MMHKPTERGQALILIALAAIGLFAFAALAIDGSRSFSNKRHAQNAADTSVLTAALKYIRTNSDFTAAESAAKERATSNGYTDDNDVSDGYATIVDVDRCDTGHIIDKDVHGNVINIPGDLDALGNEIPCSGLPTGADPKEYLRVKIVSTIPTTFGRVLGRKTLTAAVEAISHVIVTTSTSSSGVYSGAAMVSIRESGKNCLKMNGGGYLHTHNSGIYINCDDPDAISLMSNSQTIMDSPGQVVGCWNDSTGNKSDTSAVHSNIVCDANSGNSQQFTADDFASTPTMPPLPPCPPGPITRSGTQLSPGTLSGNLIIDSETVFLPGTYCVDSINVQNNAKLTGTGDVKFVLGGTFNMKGGEGVNYNFSGLEIFTTNGDFTLKGNLTVSDYFRFYSSGTGNFNAEAKGNMTSAQNTYIYLAKGNINWTSDSNLNLHAPTADNDPFGAKGLLVYKPYKPLKNNGDTNDSTITFNGGSNCVLYGTFLAPTSPIYMNGGTGFALHSQIIGWDYMLNGNSTTDIWYDAADNYNPAPPATPKIEFTK